ncbi:hypothetical protein Scep_011543 [Stephania cephalantha]|uniref:Uncharacterized protein n=1 Tax=Stephania cephalantha TaxID=152367 RepID=A0AAP0JFI4_9MAGN
MANRRVDGPDGKRACKRQRLRGASDANDQQLQRRGERHEAATQRGERRGAETRRRLLEMRRNKEKKEHVNLA